MDKFKFGGKWFWIGIVCSVLSPGVGIIYAIALMLEREHRREGLVILIVSLLMLAGLFIFLGKNPNLIKIP